MIFSVADDAVLPDERGFKSGDVGAGIDFVQVVVIATELDGARDGHHKAPHRIVNCPQWTHLTFSRQ